MDFILILLLTLLVFVASVVGAAFYALTPSYALKGKSNIPSVKNVGIAWPIIGNGYEFTKIRSSQDLWNVTEALMKNMPTKGLSTFWLGRKLLVLVSSPESYEELIINPKVSNKDMDLYGEFNRLTDGPFSRNGKQWTDFRVPLDKLMHRLQGTFGPVTAELLPNLWDALDGKKEREVFDMDDVSRLFFWDVAMESLLGVPGTALKTGSEDPHLLARALELVLTKVLIPHYRIDWIWKWSSGKKELDEIVAQLMKGSRKIIEARHAYYEENQINPQDPNFTPLTYTDIAIKIGRDENMAEETLCGTLFDVIGGVLDTPAPVMSTTLLFLAMHPEVQEKVYKEQVDLMGTNKGIPSEGEMSEMRYLKMAMYETMRILETPALARVASSEIVTGDGSVIPEGSSVIFFARKMAISPEYWERPDEYYPEHFLPEKVAKRPKVVFLPWSSGPRMCPGKQFTLATVIMALSTLVRRYEFFTNMKFQDIRYKYLLLLESVDGCPVHLKKR